MNRPLRSPAALVAAGLLPPERLAAIERVAERYAISITPDMAELIDPSSDGLVIVQPEVVAV